MNKTRYKAKRCTVLEIWSYYGASLKNAYKNIMLILQRNN